jgi:hypothetical protein
VDRKRTGQRNRTGSLLRPLGRFCRRGQSLVFTSSSRISLPILNLKTTTMASNDVLPSNRLQHMCKRCNDKTAVQHIRSERVCEQVLPRSFLKSHTDPHLANALHNMSQQKPSSVWKHIEFEVQVRKLRENSYFLFPSDPPLPRCSIF